MHIVCSSKTFGGGGLEGEILDDSRTWHHLKNDYYDETGSLIKCLCSRGKPLYMESFFCFFLCSCIFVLFFSPGDGICRQVARHRPGRQKVERKGNWKNKKRKGKRVGTGTTSFGAQIQW